MPNNKKHKKIRNYNRYKSYHEAMKPISVKLTNDSIVKILLEMWEK